MQKVTQPQPPATPAAMPGQQVRRSGLGDFPHPMRGRQDHGAEGGGRPIVQALPPVRDAEVGGGSQGLHARIDLLQMPTQALLPVIHAENQLRGGATVPVVPAPPALIVEEGVKDLVPVMILEGPQPDEAGGSLIQAIEALENEREPGWVQIPQGRARHSQMLGQPEKGPGTMKEVPTQPRRRGAPAPGPDELGQGVPMLGPGLFQRILPGSHQALGAAGQIFRQGPAEQGPAHQEFRGVVAEMLA